MTTIWSPLLRRLRQWSRSSRGRTRKLEGMEYSNCKTPCRDQPNNSSDRISSSDSQVNYESRVGENTLPSCNAKGSHEADIAQEPSILVASENRHRPLVKQRKVGHFSNGEEEVQEPPTQSATDPESSLGYQRSKGKNDNTATVISFINDSRYWEWVIDLGQNIGRTPAQLMSSCQ